MADDIDPIGSVKVKIKDSSNNECYITASNNRSGTNTTCSSGQDFVKTTTPTGGFTLHYVAPNDVWFYLNGDGGSATISSTITRWEMSGNQLQVSGNSSKQLKADLSLGSSGDAVSLTTCTP